VGEKIKAADQDADSHRRIGLTDLLGYREKTDRRRKEALAAIATEAQELKLYE